MVLAMARTRTIFRCMQCGYDAPKWVGQCSGCGEWNTLVEEIEPTSDPLSVAGGLASAGIGEIGLNPPRVQPITEVQTELGQPVPTDIEEFDRVLGGGLVPGSVTLLGGEPGVGKSTLVLQLLAARARAGTPVLYVTGEESASQVRLRAERLGALDERISLVAATSLPEVLGHIAKTRPALCVVDSIQTMHSPDLSSAPGSVGQVRECAFRLVQLAKATATTIVIVGHVTKEGSLAGPRVLEHIVDTVLNFEGDKSNALRILRAAKHRFGSTEEVGLFTMVSSGLIPVPDPSGLFLGDRRSGVSGSVVTPTIQGYRPVLVEIQTLASRSYNSNPRRYTQGIDSGRLSMLLAVISSQVGLPTQSMDVYANAAGGVRISDPGADLAICASLISMVKRRPVDESIVICGEVGLGGEVRQVSRIDYRLTEAARLGFTTAIVPLSAPVADVPMRIIRAGWVSEALEMVGLSR